MLLCFVSILFWPEAFAGQWLLQLLLMIFLAIVLWRLKFTAGIAYEFTLNENGRLYLYTEQGQGEDFVLLPTSVVSDWFCHLRLKAETLPGQKGKNQALWLFRDGVDEQSYRRICRIVFRLRQQPKQ